LGYNFNNATLTGPATDTPSADPEIPIPNPQADRSSTAAPPPATSDSPQSAALVRFRSCRWMQPPENGNASFCTHREVKPYAGMQGFDAEAWCPECQYYKLRRAPRKRTDDHGY